MGINLNTPSCSSIKELHLLKVQSQLELHVHTIKVSHKYRPEGEGRKNQTIVTIDKNNVGIV